MRILYLHQYFNTPEMAGGTRSYEMARRLAAKGHEVHVVTSWKRPTERSGWFTTEEAGVRVHWIPVPYSNEMPFRDRIKSFFRFATLAAARAAGIAADVVFASSTPLTIAIPGAYAAWRQNIPMIFEVRDLWPEVPIAMGALRNPVAIAAARQLERFAYARSTRVVALSPGMKDGVVSAGYPAAQVSVIPNSSDLELFDSVQADRGWFYQAHPELTGKKLVLYAGTFGRINRVDYLVEVAKAVVDQDLDVAFVAMGAGSEKAAVRELADRSGVLGRNFFLYDPVPKSDVPNAFAAADLVLSLCVDLDATRKNSANKFFDALAAGKPIAVNYGGWQADLIGEHELGLVLPPSSPDQAAKLISDRLKDKDWVGRCGGHARALAEARFSRDKLAAELEAVLLDSVAEYRARNGQAAAGAGGLRSRVSHDQE